MLENNKHRNFDRNKFEYFMSSQPKRFWALVFCVISLFSLLFIVPYKLSIPAKFLTSNYYRSVNGNIYYGTFFSKPNIDKKLLPYADIIYGRLAMQEVIVAFACVGGFIITTSKK